ncbi:MAG: diguanylate cyclase [Spirochaeta sp.]
MTYTDDRSGQGLKLFRSFISNTDNSSPISIIQNRNGLIPESILSQNETLDTTALFTCPQTIDRLYFPFLSCLKQHWNPRSPFRLSAFLPRQQPVIAACLSGETTPETEEILLDEWGFEKRQLQTGLLRTMFSLCRENRIIIQQAQYLPAGSLEVLLHAAETSPGLPIILVDSGVHEKETADSWNLVTEIAENHNTYIRLSDTCPEPSPAPPLPISTDSALTYAKHSLSLYAADEAQRILLDLLGEHDAQIRSIPEYLRLDIYLQLGRIAYFKQNWDECIVRLQHMSALADRLDTKVVLAQAYWRIGMAFLYKDDLVQADHLAGLTREIAADYKLPPELFYAEYLRWKTAVHRRQHEAPEIETLLGSLLGMAEKLGFHNTFAEIAAGPACATAAWNTQLKTFHQRGIETAMRLQNHLRLAEAYQARGLCYARQGRYDDSLREYTASLEMWHRVEDPGRLASIYNSIGCFRLIRGDYRQAMHDFTSAMQQLKSIHEYDQAAATLYNMAVASLLALDFTQALTYIQHCRRLMRLTQQARLQSHSRCSIACLHGLALAASGKEVQAQRIADQLESCSRTRQQDGSENSNEDGFWFAFLQTVLAREVKTQQHYSAVARRHLTDSREHMAFAAPFFYYLLAYLEIDADANRQLCRSEAKSLDNSFYIRASSRSPALNPESRLTDSTDRVDTDFEWLFQRVNLYTHLTQLHRKMNSYSFLSGLQSLLNNCSSTGEVIQTAVEHIYTGLPVSSVYYHAVTPEAAVVPAGYRGHDQFPDSAVTGLAAEALKNHRRHLLPDERTGTALHFCIGSPPDLHGSLLCRMQNPLQHDLNETIRTLRAAARQIDSTLKNVRHQEAVRSQQEELNRENALLHKLSVIDVITSLGNRNALYRVLRTETSRLNRYGDADTTLSIMFIDLDNFQQVNDLLGYEHGDMVLSRVARLITAELRETDYAFRYGGDEFVVVLPETPAHCCHAAAQRIHNRVRETSSTIIESPENPQLQLSLSIGITHTKKADAPFDPEVLLYQADHALYSAKSAGKNRTLVF